MSYVPGFTNDIFISFSHADNWDGWVDKFQDHLNHRLIQLGAPVKIWRDPKLGGADVFSDEIFTQLQRSALFIPIISPSWDESPWCEDECQAFERFAALNGGFRVDSQLRAIKVVKTPLSADKHRDLFGIRGFEFYKWETQSRYFHEFHQSSPEFDARLNELAQDIKRFLEAFSEHLKAASQIDFVYVATTTPDLKPSRDKIVEELEESGYAVLPRDSDLPRLASFQAVTKAELTACIFSVHMVSDQPKPILEDGHDSITEQYLLAQSLRKYRIVWIEPNRELYSNFDEALESGLQNRLDILKNRTIQGLKDVIRDQLDQRGNPPAQVRKRKTRTLIRDRRDHTSADSRRKRALSASENSNPFPGLRAFEREQSHLFFGRDEQIRDLLERLETHRFLPIMGVSGSGKSSLVRAGLIPGLTGSYVETEASDWRIAMLRPGRNPMNELATELCREFDVSEVDDVLDTLRGSSAGLAHFAREHLRSGEMLLVFVDQFEELFRYHEADEPTGETDDDVAFVNLLLAAAGESKHTLPGFDDLPVYIVTTIRSEYLGQCSRFHGLPEALNETQYLVPRLTRGQQREVIERPIKLADASIEPALVRELLNDLDDNPDQLPALQHALMRTWEHAATAREQGRAITVTDYEAVGGMAHALDRDATEVYEALSNDDGTRAITRRLFQRLVAPDKETRSPTSFSELLGITAADESDLKKVVDLFKERGFLTVSGNKHQIIDITHESLIRDWKQLRRWVQEEGESAENYRRLADTATRYARGGALLFVDPELQVMLDWLEKTKPNQTWAARYDSRFTEAVDFLEQSRKQQQQSEAQRIRSIGFRSLILLSLLFGPLVYVAFNWGIGLAKSERNNHLLYDANIFLAADAMASDQFTSAQDRLDELLTVDLKELRGFEWFHIWRTVHADRVTLAGHSGAVVSVAFSQDGKTIVSASADKTVKLWDIAAHKDLTIMSGSEVFSVASSPDGQTLAIGSSDQTVKLWNTSTRQEVISLSGHSGSILATAFSHDGKILASASADKTVKLWDTATYKVRATFPSHSRLIKSLTFSKDGILAAAGDDIVTLWDTTARKELTTISAKNVSSAAFSTDGKILAFASGDNTIKLWDTVSRKVLVPLSGHSDSILSVAFSPDGNTLASAGNDKTVRLWDMSARKEVAVLSGHSGAILSVAFSPDGKTLASASADNTVKLWDTAPTVFSHSCVVWSVAFSPDGKILASACDNTVKLWDTVTRTEIASLPGHTGSVISVAFSPDGKTLASASNDKTVKLWDMPTRTEIITLSGHSGFVWSVAFSPDGKTLASASADKTVKLWDTVTHKPIATLSGHSGAVVSVAFSPDGYLASASFDNTVKLWDVDACKKLITCKEQVGTLSGHSGSVLSVAFSPDGRTLASASFDNTVKLWDTPTFKGKLWNPPKFNELATLSGHSRAVWSVAFSPDGKTLVSASDDNTVKLWDTSTWKELMPIFGHVGFVTSVTFSPDGKTLASAGADKTVKLWFAATDEEVQERRRRGYQGTNK